MANQSFYKLGVGDQIRIQVYDEPELSLETRVSDSGTIDYPFLGRIKLKGKTTEEVKAAIHDGLLDGYLINPNVFVSVVMYRPYFINGQVKTSGSYPYYPGLTVNKAITIAGGFTERASKTKIYISSSDEPSAQPVKVNLLDKIQPGDIITVEESFF
ncbi:polysaccharide biosynthesis/export family protein [Vibrio anguillarum]|uniref:polysaccharide biosynthesis/export family protein n=1 Tax=Vibrio anguillarum TaxID=55601 RepID=UPI00188A3866|nr:polysaccharide biosynthesis/export family protein [Vibrio anguillarum]MBF4323294.1 polysaccharide export protein [Vibrio anguillarum]